ncbi:methanogen output domain 1-containing protein [Pseudohongiella sp. O18]|uniref:methanogen output domain 1-containing protein n=1 Tax=Pseudohongiella sp. O18 TaxID=2904248 RepID=UPI001F4132B4|nr:methanogen output domain 1-containing protein [Pseudohongiella sp. O18]
MTQSDQSKIPVKELEIPLERDVFMRSMLRELAGALQDVVGMEEAAGFVSLVGQRIGDQLNNSYREALSQRRLSREQVADVLVDLKRRINGGFSIVEQNDERIVLSNTRCPFAEKVEGRPALCMMTSNVFGNITAENLGYARVDLEETIADGAPGCRVVIHLILPADEQVTGREYFRG